MRCPRPSGYDWSTTSSRATNVLVSWSSEAKRQQLPVSNVVGAHQAQRAVTDVLELASNGLTVTHREVGKTAFERLHPGLLVEADHMVAGKRVVVDVQHVVALLPKLVVMRRQVHLLSVRLQCGLCEDAADRAIADVEALTTKPTAEQRLRPVRDGDPYILGRSTGFGLDAGCVGVREREGRRPERGASASKAVGSSAALNRFFQQNTVRT